MKKFIIPIIFVLMLFSFGTMEATIDTSATGWVTSSGLNSMPGFAEGTTKIERGWSVWCLGNYYTCYQITGNILIIYDCLDAPDEDAEAIYVEIIKF